MGKDRDSLVPHARSDDHRGEQGFTLIELLITVAVIGIIAAIAVVNLQSALDKSRQRKTMATMRNVGTAIEAYSNDHSAFPRNGISAAELSAALSDQVYKRVETTDAWGNDLAYTSGSDHYTVESYGRDGADGPQNITRATAREFDYDIVFADGGFLNAPD